MHLELPFETKNPNADTTEALHQAESVDDLAEYATLKQLKTATR